MIKHIIKMISSALFNYPNQKMQGMHSLIQEASNNYTQGEYFEHLAMRHHQEFLLHHSSHQPDLSQTDYRNAMWNFLSAALRGHKEAQYKLGIGYLNGDLGLEKNFSLAELWLKKAADQGYSPAQNALMHAYEKIIFC
ncbi:tetratricopeptide repeat protein [Acinetobacter pragensis]|uniref:tetratricopeptide repeat protein n=1 Tax=Acinetobacter pragensis TaxID=1806892 RepID=UPI0033418E62